MKTKPTQQQLSDFVNREVYLCQSSLVDALLSRDPSDILSWGDVVNLYDYECEECGCIFTQEGLEKSQVVTDETRETGQVIYLCPGCGVERPEFDEKMKEVLEWWVVSDWLANELEERGEAVLRSDYGTWWGRTCSGQAISLDGVIEDIHLDLNK